MQKRCYVEAEENHTMSEWTKKIKDEARGLFAEAEQELTALEGADTVDLTADDTTTDTDPADPDPADTDPTDTVPADPEHPAREH